MTRVSGVPNELRAAASLLAASGPELETAAVLLAGVPLPEMPPGVSAATVAALTSAARTLNGSAKTSTHEGEELHRRGLWLEVAGAGGNFLWTAANSPFKSLGTMPLDRLDLNERRKALSMLNTWKRYLRAVKPLEDEYGPNSEQAWEVTWRLRRRLDVSPSQFREILARSGDLAEYEKDADVPLAGLRTIGGRILGPLGIITGGWELFHPGHSGWQGWGDRVSGAAGAAGSVGATGIAYFGLETATLFVPGVDVVTGTLLLASAGWEVYTHRKEIAHAVVKGAGYVIHHPVVLTGPPGIAAQEVWDHRQQIAKGAVSIGKWGEHRIEDAAKPAVSLVHKIFG